MNDPNQIYTFTIMWANGEDGAIGQAFANARDNPKYRKTDLMAAVLAGWYAGNAYALQMTREHLAASGYGENPDKADTV